MAVIKSVTYDLAAADDGNFDAGMLTFGVHVLNKIIIFFSSFSVIFMIHGGCKIGSGISTNRNSGKL